MNQLYKTESRGDISRRTQHVALQYPQRLKWIALFAIVSQIIFLASAWLLPALSEYTLIGDNISELVLGQYGFVQTFASLIAGLGTLGLAYAIRRLTVGTRGSLTGSLLVGVFGVGTLLFAFFPTDRIDTPADVWTQSTTGMVHLFVALISFVAVVIGMFVLAWTFSKDTRWRSLIPWAAILPGAALSLLFVQSEGPWVGIMQRALVTVITAWLIMVAFRVRTLATPGEGANR